jgi:hypothetical protein
MLVGICACRVLVRIGGEEMLSWGGANPEQTLHALLQAVAWLLKPEAGDSASLGIGGVRAQSIVRTKVLRICWENIQRLPGKGLL